EEVTLAPGSRRLLIDLDKVNATEPAVLASACKTLGAQKTPEGAFQFHAEGPANIEAVMRVALPEAPKEVTLDGRPLAADAREWDAKSRTLRLRFPNAPEGHQVSIH
ncbi:hypothetical protein ACYOEI_16255, partial [Singulisphaera rosea]